MLSSIFRIKLGLFQSRVPILSEVMIYLFSFLIFFIIIINNLESSCKTPDDKDGDCIVLQECDSLYKLLKGSVTTEQRIFLKKSQCGRDHGKIFVCCPVRGNQFTIDDLPSNDTCGITVPDKIYGGHKTSINEFPW